MEVNAWACLCWTKRCLLLHKVLARTGPTRVHSRRRHPLHSDSLHRSPLNCSGRVVMFVWNTLWLVSSSAKSTLTLPWCAFSYVLRLCCNNDGKM